MHTCMYVKLVGTTGAFVSTSPYESRDAGSPSAHFSLFLSLSPSPSSCPSLSHSLFSSLSLPGVDPFPLLPPPSFPLNPASDLQACCCCCCCCRPRESPRIAFVSPNSTAVQSGSFSATHFSRVLTARRDTLESVSGA